MKMKNAKISRYCLKLSDDKKECIPVVACVLPARALTVVPVCWEGGGGPVQGRRKTFLSWAVGGRWPCPGGRCSCPGGETSTTPSP